MMDNYSSMSDNYIDRPAQIPLRKSQMEYLLVHCSPLIWDRWVVYHHPNHFIFYDKVSKYCIYDAEYTCLKDSGEPDAIVAVISKLRINQDEDQHPDDIEDDFDEVADIILEVKKMDFNRDQNDPISSMDEAEFIEYVANDCIANMSEEEKQSFIDDPDPVSHHFGYGTYIRNEYIYGKELPFFVVMADDLSARILERIISILNPSS